MAHSVSARVTLVMDRSPLIQWHTLMSAFSRVAEKKIREAIEQGEFDRLPGRGEPIDLEGYFKLPVELRLSYSILRSAGCVPTEVELLRAIDRTRSELRQATDPAKRQALQKQLNEEELRLRLALENRQNG